MTNEKYIIKMTTFSPTDYREEELINSMYVDEIDLHNMDWKLTPIFTEAKVFSLEEVSHACAILNKINKCYFIIIPTFDIKILQSKINLLVEDE